jgi:hypothetical protein
MLRHMKPCRPGLAGWKWPGKFLIYVCYFLLNDFLFAGFALRLVGETLLVSNLFLMSAVASLHAVYF